MIAVVELRKCWACGGQAPIVTRYRPYRQLPVEIVGEHTIPKTTRSCLTVGTGAIPAQLQPGDRVAARHG